MIQLRKYGFTMIEMLMVVAIIAILAAFILPTYQMNTTKTKLTNVVTILNQLMHDVLQDYARTGSPPITLSGVSGNGAGSYGEFIIPNATTNLHYVNGQGWGESGAMISVNVPIEVGRGIPGFVQSTDGSDGAFNSVTMAFYEKNGTIIIFCGRWDSNNPIYVPIDYLPSGCNTDNIQDLVAAV